MPIEELNPTDLPPSEEEAPSRERTYGPGMRKLHGQLADLYTNIGAMVVTPLDRLAGTLLVAQADELADTWIDLAETNPRVKEALKRLVEVGGWGGVLAAHGLIVLPVLANRGMLPEQVAQGAAAMTVVQHPTTAPLFTHPRFNRSPDNGNGAVG